MTSTELDRLAAMLARWVPESELREAYTVAMRVSSRRRDYRAEIGVGTPAHAYYLAIQASAAMRAEYARVYPEVLAACRETD